MSIIQFGLGVNQRHFDKAIALIEEIKGASDVTVGFQLPLLVDSPIKTLFMQGLNDAVKKMLDLLIDEIKYIPEIPDVATRNSYLKNVTDFNTFINAIRVTGKRYAITYYGGDDPEDGDDRYHQYMFVVDANGDIQLQNIFTEKGDIISGLLRSFNNSGVRIDFGVADEPEH